MWSVSPLAVIDGTPWALIATSGPWQTLRLHEVDAVCWEGGIPWHAPHFAALPDGSVHTGTAAGSARFAPWQATAVHEVPFHTGDEPRATARPVKVTWTIPSRWNGSVIDVGTG